jgi:hypothetical protein
LVMCDGSLRPPGPALAHDPITAVRCHACVRASARDEQHPLSRRVGSVISMR